MKTVLAAIKWFFIFLLAAFMTIMILGLTFAACDTSIPSPTTTPATIQTEPTTPTEKVIKPAPIRLTYVSWEQDYVGGNYIYISIKNLTDKNIAWVEYTLSLYNVKGELLKDDIRGWTYVSWYDGPIAPNSSVEINGGPFYNSYFKGSIQVNKIIIQYENGNQEEIFASDFENYETLLYNSKEIMVWVCSLSTKSHTKDCHVLKEILQKWPNTIIGEKTIQEALRLSWTKCPDCNPY